MNPDKPNEEVLDPGVAVAIMAALAAVLGDTFNESTGQIRIRESWPRTTLWRWL
ncbi:MAG: hypothetical protein ACYCOU_14905 [Sulfobacillus sp.]